VELTPGYKQTEVGLIPDDWDAKPLGSITTLMTNGFVGTVKDAYVDSDDGVLYVQGYNVEENGFNFHGIKRVSLEFHAQHQKSSLRVGDLLTIQTGDIGVTTVVTPSIAGANCHALVISRLEKRTSVPGYYCQYFNSERGRAAFKEIETGSTMKHLNVGDMVKLLVPSPPVEEQRSIAAALSDVDALLTKLDQFIAKKRDLKQATMQQLLTGQTRLPGFSGEWEVKRLGDVAPLQRGYDLPTTQIREGSFPVVYSNGILNHHQQFMVKGPGVVTGRSGTIGNVHFVDDNYWPHNTSLWVTNFNGNAAKFVFYLLGHLGLERFGTGSGVPTLNRNDVHAQRVAIPSSHQEQTAIASILSDMDAELAALESRRDKTHALKQGMMQELLTGRIRLV
jgi:type I restriction enzyme S subunit